MGDRGAAGVGDLPAVLAPALVKSRAITDIVDMSKAPTGNLSLKALVEDARGIGISADEVREIHKVVKSHRPPADVRAVEVNFGRDWIGAPAAWIWYLVEDDLDPSKEKIVRLNKFATSVQDALLKTSPSYFPYVDFRATH
jgi:hypothetical protein